MHPMLNIAIRAARRAGNIIVRGMSRIEDLKVERKGRHDYVSEIDHEAESAIVETLLTAYPDHAIVAEESGQQGDSDHIWIIDPLDGTLNYLHSFPQFAVSIGLQINNRMEHGVVYDPTRDELFTASRGAGALCNNRKIRVSRCQSMESALLATGFPVRHEAQIEPYLGTLGEVLKTSAGIRRAGAAALDLAYVASGRVDGFWEFGLQPWDVAAGSLLVEEAGGLVSDVRGGQGYVDSGDIIAATPKLLKGLAQAVTKVPFPAAG
ncbi:MAG: inositol monophosphatase family protein [Pseudomonadota bacterium]